MTQSQSAVSSTGRSTTLIQPRRVAGRWWRLVFKLAIVVAAAVLAWRLLEEIGWHELRQRARDAQPALLSLAILALVARFVLAFRRWALALRLLGKAISPFYGFSALMAAALVNHVTVTARLLGGVVRARYVSRRSGISFAKVFATVLVDQVSHQIVLGLLTWLALIWLAWAVGWRSLSGLLFGALVLLSLAILIWRRRRQRLGPHPIANLIRQKVERQARRLGPLLGGGRRVVSVLRRAFSDSRLQFRMALYGAALLPVNALAQWLLFRSLGTRVDFTTVLITIAVGIGAGIVTGTPGGIVTTEAAMVAVFVAFGVSEIDAAAGTLLYRGLHYATVLILGLPALTYCELSVPSAPRSRDPRASADPPGNGPPAAQSPRDRVA